MTTTIASSKKTRGGKSPLLLVVIVLVLAVLAAMLPTLLQQQPTHSIPLPGGRGNVRVHYNPHALRGHPEAPLVRLGCESGPEMIFKHRGEDKFAFLCFTEKGWGIMIVQKIKGVWEEINSFIPKDGTKEAVRRYLDGFATPFKGLLP
jgi:hypothetical protein